MTTFTPCGCFNRRSYIGRLLSTEEVKNRIRENFIQDVILLGEYKTKRDPIVLFCNDCQWEWSTKASNVLYTEKGKHHCPSCGNTNANRKTGIIANCSWCGKEVYRKKSRVDINKTGYFYCSIQCGNLHKNSIRRESGEWDKTSNYRKLAFSTKNHECAICGYDEEKRILEVHHIDENRDNNSEDNLIILCPNCHRKITLYIFTLDELKNN